MQSVSSRIWTRVAVSISYDDNDYTTGKKQKVSRKNNYRRQLRQRHSDTGEYSVSFKLII